MGCKRAVVAAACAELREAEQEVSQDDEVDVSGDPVLTSHS
jgi:hypothetical protein